MPRCINESMRSFLSFASLAVPLLSEAQNLVPNGDFEQYSQCPDYVSQIDRAVGWMRPTQGTSDYLNACLGVPFSLSVPDNQFGDQAARSGNGYAGFYCFYETGPFTAPGDHDREYVTHALAAPLVPGRTYEVAFHVSLADASKYAVNEIGAQLSVAVPQRSDDLPIQHAPQIAHNGSWLDDKSGWTRIAGCFVADSAYRYITIGNFRNGASTAFLQVPTPYPLTWYSYYYMDDVSVSLLEPPQLGPDIIACDAVSLAVLNPVAGAAYQWSNGASGTAIIADAGGLYAVTRTDLSCPLADTIQVSFMEPIELRLPADTIADLCAAAVELAVVPLPSGASVQWSTNDAAPSILVREPGSYWVRVEAPGFCPANATIAVHDECGPAPYAPAAFTPNNDGINDHWMPVWSAHPAARMSFVVFDRWGRTAQHGAHGEGWDGTIAGTQAPTGVYTYRLIAEDPASGSSMVRTGSITLIR